MRALIVIFTVVAVTISLIVLIPSGFYSSSLNPLTTPDVDPASIIAWNSTTTYTLNYTASAVTNIDFQLNGYNYRIMVVGYSEPAHIDVLTYAYWGPFYWDFDSFQWFKDGVDITQFDEYYSYKSIYATTVDNYDNPAKFTIENTKTRATLTFVYDDATYASFNEALKADAATAVFNVEWDDRNTSMNALQLVGLVLTASLPNIHPALSAIFAFVGWGLIAASAYLAFIFVLRIVGAVFGGGGA